VNILWLAWKDLSHPLAGGAEVVSDNLARRLALDGHEVKMLVGGHRHARAVEKTTGVEIIRLGGRYTVYYRAWRYYRRYLRGWPDLIIDEINTIPFFARFYAQEPVILFFHMLCRKIWFYQAPPPIGLVGYIVEPLYLRLLAGRPAIAMSESTKRDLIRHGFTEQGIAVIPEAVELEPIKDLEAVEKFEDPTVLSLGAIRAMKRTLDQLKAFEIAKETLPELKLVIAGQLSRVYGPRVARAVARSRFKADITVLGRVRSDQKIQLMRRSHAIMVTSVKEGWGLVVTEAAGQGTPAVVYDVDGLRDSVRHDQTGFVTPASPSHLAESLVELLNDSHRYAELRHAAWAWSRELTFDRSYREFAAALKTRNRE
jgi:glycosyltransferase involved in cell wall biosynthesis